MQLELAKEYRIDVSGNAIDGFSVELSLPTGRKIERGMTIAFHYKNWQDVSAERQCVVIGQYYGKNEWHKENQFLLKGMDSDKNQERTYAIRDMSDLKILSR